MQSPMPGLGLEPATGVVAEGDGPDPRLNRSTNRRIAGPLSGCALFGPVRPASKLLLVTVCVMRIRRPEAGYGPPRLGSSTSSELSK